ncbi:MAG: DUF6768 family protein [Polaribacter sp.]|uniref:DUF6768 family protein n=1 Tax=Polaribacter sp. TaxID=1920175 RepID=UPI002F35F7AB
MKNNKEEIDKLIKETLTQEEARFYDELEEQNIFRKVLGIFKGKNAFISIIMNITNIIVFGFFIYCIVQAFDVENTNELILWVGATILCFITMSMIKIFSWMQMNKNDLSREIKRLELLVTANSTR